jgi:hypothetical protein
LVGVDNPYDNAFAETADGIVNPEVIRRRGPMAPPHFYLHSNQSSAD